jgi:hypothetical protein
MALPFSDSKAKPCARDPTGHEGDLASPISTRSVVTITKGQALPDLLL